MVGRMIHRKLENGRSADPPIILDISGSSAIPSHSDD
jgi:hypothetical protein